MKIGIPTEIKNHEYRVGLLPAGCRELTLHGHQALVQAGAGQAIGYDDEAYQRSGAQILPDANAVFAQSDLIVKVKEPEHEERLWLNEQHTLFAYLHLAPDIEQTRELLASGATCIAYETVTDQHGRLPLLAPMSEVAGRMSVQAGAVSLEKSQGGAGLLLGGVPGTPRARVLILGGGVVGQSAARIAIGMGASVTIIDKSLEALRALDNRFGSRVQTLYSTRDAVETEALRADLIIGAALVPGAAAPKLIDRELVSAMKPGTVLVDVAIDQGGCFATSKPTTHDAPTFIVDDVVHYCVANMPGAVPKTSATALSNATLPYVLELADQGPEAAMRNNAHLRSGLNIHRGALTNPAVAAAQGLEATEPASALAG
ncbi:MAG: alanine dehydrogenase [Pseudomonadales bacterium]